MLRKWRRNEARISYFAFVLWGLVAGYHALLVSCEGFAMPSSEVSLAFLLFFLAIALLLLAFLLEFAEALFRLQELPVVAAGVAADSFHLFHGFGEGLLGLD